MAKTLQDYLGSNSTLTTAGILSVDLAELKLAIDNNGIPAEGLNDDQAISVLVAALHNNAKPNVDSEGIEIVDPETAIVSSDSFSPKTFEVRGETSQIRNEFIFNIYTVDSTNFDPDNVV